MAELAKTHISITDESAFADGINTLVPLYVFATAQDKIIDEASGEIAIGTTKELAGELSVVTSRKDVTEKFGTPFFEEVNGAIQQGSELNEIGLYGLFDAMGSTSLAYALRADIDLDQLRARETEPVSPAKNGTRWLDVEKSTFGLFIRNSSTTKISSKQWDSVNYKIIENGNIDKIEDGTFVINFVNNDFEIGQVNNGIYNRYDNIIVDSSMSYPTCDDGMIWVRTTPINGGNDIVLKQYVSSTGRWETTTVPTFKDKVNALAQMSDLASNAPVYIFNGTKFELDLSSTDTKQMNIELTVDGGISTIKNISIKTILNGTAKILTYSVPNGQTFDSSSIIELNAQLKQYGKKGLVLTTEENKVLLSGEATCIQMTINDSSVNDSIVLEKYISPITVSDSEPTSDAAEGTLWFNDDMKVDIMVNDGLGKWVGFNNAYGDSINPKIYVCPEEPILLTDIVDYSLWIDTNNPNYPTIYRMYDGEWVLLDNTDQTTPDGVLFADARYYAEDEEPTYLISDDGSIVSNLLSSNKVDPDCPNPLSYPKGMILFNTRFSTNNVKEFKQNPFVGLYDEQTLKYTVGNTSWTLKSTQRWVCASGNDVNGQGLFGKKAQRKMVVNALESAITSNDDIRSMDYDFFFATCPGYPELDDELLNLNTDKKEMFYIVSDTPKTLEPNGKKIQEWATNANNATSHGSEGRVLMNEYMTRQYPPMGLSSNVDGSEIAIPSSIVKMKNLLVLPRGQICAGTQYGQITNVSSVGYITDENEYSPVVVSDGLGEICCAQNINPLMPRRGTGLLIWGERTENSSDSSLSDEHAVLTILRLKRRLEEAVQPFFFRINNASIRTEFNNVLESVLNDFVGTGEIYDYALETGDSVNTPERINRRELWANIAVEVSKGIEQIYLPIRVVSTGSL